MFTIQYKYTLTYILIFDFRESILLILQTLGPAILFPLSCIEFMLVKCKADRRSDSPCEGKRHSLAFSLQINLFCISNLLIISHVLVETDSPDIFNSPELLQQ